MARLLLLAVFLTASLAAGVGAGSTARRFHGTLTIAASLTGPPHRVLARPAGSTNVVCGASPIESLTYDLTADSAIEGCDGALWFWLRQRPGPSLLLAESALPAGPANRVLNLHLWSPMRTYGDVVSTQDLAGAAVVACTPSCTAPRHTVCGGAAIASFSFAARVLPRSPMRACPADGKSFRYGLRLRDGTLFPAAEAGRFVSEGAARFDLVAGFSKSDTVSDYLTNRRPPVSRGGVTSFAYNVNLAQTRGGMTWWVEVDGPEGTVLRSISGTDPLGEHPLHNTWRCDLHARIPGPDAAPRSARCTGFIGPPPPGRYTLFVEIKAPPRRGIITVRLFNVAGADHAQETVRIAVR